MADKKARTSDLRELASQDWQACIRDYDINDVEICYPDTDRRGCYVGPLMTVNMGMTFENEDGDEVVDLGGMDGVTLTAVMCLPQFARLVTWADDELRKLTTIEPSGENRDTGAFLAELRARVDWLIEAIDGRDTSTGFGEGHHSIGSYDRTKKFVKK